MQLEVGDLDPKLNFGASVRLPDPDVLDDPAVRRALNDLWIERGLIVFRGMADPDCQMRIGAVFGELGVHPMSSEEKLRAPVTPSDVIYTSTRTGDLYQVNGLVLGGYQPWHADWIYMDEVARGGVMRAVELPGMGGDTGFIDRIEAYETLPRDLAARIEGLDVLYRYYADASLIRFGHRPERALHLSAHMLAGEVHPRIARRAIHPMVCEQAETGRRILNISQWFADAIVGMEDEAGDALLAQVISHCIEATPQYRHVWRKDNIAVWDNRRMLHCAWGVPPGERRHMQRLDVLGDYGLGRYEA